MSISKGTKIENTQINEKINYTDALSLEEIQASTDLNRKVASASALKGLSSSVKSNFMRGCSGWIENNTKMTIGINIATFVFITYGSGESQYAIYYINKGNNGFIQRISGSINKPSVSLNENRSLVITNTIGWPMPFYILGDYEILEITSIA